MDKQTYSQYGWVVVVIVIIAILIGASTPFVGIIKAKFQDVVVGVKDVQKGALDKISKAETFDDLNAGSGGGSGSGALPEAGPVKNQYGFYFDRMYEAEFEGEYCAVIFYTNGLVESFVPAYYVTENMRDFDVIVSSPAAEMTYDTLTATHWDGLVYEFSDDGSTVTCEGLTYTLSDTQPQGIYFEATYRCVEEGYENAIATLHEDGYVLYDGENYDMTWQTKSTGAEHGAGVYTSLDGSTVFIAVNYDYLKRFELVGAPVITVDHPVSKEETAPTVVDGYSCAVSGSVLTSCGLKTLTVNNVVATVAPDGSWIATIDCPTDETTTVTIVATDNNGISTTETRYVYCKMPK